MIIYVAVEGYCVKQINTLDLACHELGINIKLKALYVIQCGPESEISKSHVKHPLAVGSLLVYQIACLWWLRRWLSLDRA